MASEALAGIVPSGDALAPLRAAEAELEGRLDEGVSRFGMERDRLVEAVAERTGELQRARESGELEASARMEAVQRAARGPFVEANARAWDAALWAEEGETARTGRGRAPGEEPEPGSPLARERERLGTRIDWAAVRFGEPREALRGAIQARSDALDEERRPGRDAEVARLTAEREAEQERLSRSVSLEGLAAAVQSGRELDAHERGVVEAGLEPTLRREIGDDGLARLHLGDHRALAGALPDEGDQLAVAWAQLERRAARTGLGLSARWAGVMEGRLEAWEAREAERTWEREREEEKRREAERARACEALGALAERLQGRSWGSLNDADREALRAGMGRDLERVVGAEGIDRLDQGDHAALEGVLEGAEDRVRLTQLRLLDHGELFGDAELTARGQRLHRDLMEAQITDERAQRRGWGRDLDDGLDDDYGL